jgi:hypothetical protein
MNVFVLFGDGAIIQKKKKKWQKLCIILYVWDEYMINAPTSLHGNCRRDLPCCLYGEGIIGA